MHVMCNMTILIGLNMCVACILKFDGVVFENRLKIQAIYKHVILTTGWPVLYQERHKQPFLQKRPS